MSPFQAVYGRTPPELIDYRVGDSNVETVDTLLRQKDQLIQELKGNLQSAQERMKNSGAERILDDDYTNLKSKIGFDCICNPTGRVQPDIVLV